MVPGLLGVLGILKPETMHEMWKEVEKNKGTAHKDGWYGWGWYVLPEKQSYGACRHVRKTVYHTGSIGISSLLLLLLLLPLLPCFTNFFLL